MKSLAWFNSRINKRVFRDHHDCCATCDKNYNEGLIIHDKQHAQYLFDIQNDFGVEGYELNYRDEK